MPTPTIFEQNPRKTLLAIVLTALLLIDFTAATLYRLSFGYAFPDHRYGHAPNIETTYRVPSDIYHHDLAKNVYLTDATWGGTPYTVATDSLGFKSAMPTATPLIPATYRMLFIGDSFTEGIGIRYQNTFVGRVATTLSARNIDVLNAAVSSYSPIIYYRKTKYLLDRGFRFDELVVFIDISDIQDEAVYYDMSETNTVTSKKHKNNRENMTRTVKTLIRRNFIITYLLLKSIDESIFDRDATDRKPAFAINLRRGMWTIDRSIFREYGWKGLQRADFYMDQLYRLLRLTNISLTIAVYPWPDQIVNGDLDSIQARYWRQWARRRGVRFIDYFPCFVDRSAQNPPSSYNTVRKYFVDGDVHWNENGHALIASEFISLYSKQHGECVEQGVRLR